MATVDGTRLFIQMVFFAIDDLLFFNKTFSPTRVFIKFQPAKLLAASLELSVEI
jgi:hypothetical protein